jgi:outer membrane protein
MLDDRYTQRLRVLAAAGSLAAATLAAVPATAGDYNGDFLVRAGISVVSPDSSAEVFSGGTRVPGFDAEVSTQVIPSLTLSYFFNKNLAVELFCCFAKHEATGKGGINGVDLGDFWIFPPALTLQYHFDSVGGFKPYVGAGLQYIAFFNEGRSATLGGNIKLDDAVGFTLQAGVDVEIGRGWYLNADVKKTWLETDAAWTGTPITAKVDVDPWIVSANLGYRFNLFGPRYSEPLK